MSFVRDIHVDEVLEKEKLRTQELMRRAYIPGMSIASVSQRVIPASSEAVGVVLELKKEIKIQASALGVADASDEKRTEVKSDTVFWACSLSKPVFAYLVLKLIEKGKLGKDFLDAELWDEERFGVRGDRRPLTARMILSHQTGLPNEGAPEFKFNPGDGFRYSGEGYLFLQEIIKKQTGKSLEELAQSEVFIPLGMSNSSFLYPKAKSLAKTHDAAMSPNPLPESPANNNNAAGSLHTTASDYARFLAACINDDKFLNIVMKPQISSMEKDIDARDKKIDAAILRPINWGVGFGLQTDEKGHPTTAFHWGHGPGARTFFSIRLDHPRSAVVYLTNSENGLAIAEDISAPIVGSVVPAMKFLSDKYGYRKWDAPRWDEYHISLISGVAAEKEGKFELAISLYKKAAEISPDNAELQYRMEKADAHRRLQVSPPHLSSKKQKELEGQYGSVKILAGASNLMIEVGGGRRNLIVVDENTFLDGDVILKFNREESRRPSLICHFPSGGKTPSIPVERVLPKPAVVTGTAFIAKKMKIPSASLALTKKEKIKSKSQLEHKLSKSNGLDVTDEQMAKSAFGQASHTAKRLKR